MASIHRQTASTLLISLLTSSKFQISKELTSSGFGNFAFGFIIITMGLIICGIQK